MVNILATWKIAPALAAGNCVVLKPAEQTPVSILFVIEVIADLLPTGVLNVVNGFGPEAGKPCKLYMASDQFEYYKGMHLMIDVSAGRGSSFSLEIPLGLRFMLISRLFSDDEIKDVKPVEI